MASIVWKSPWWTRRTTYLRTNSLHMDLEVHNQSIYNPLLDLKVHSQSIYSLLLYLKVHDQSIYSLLLDVKVHNQSVYNLLSDLKVHNQSIYSPFLDLKVHIWFQKINVWTSESICYDFKKGARRKVMTIGVGFALRSLIWDRVKPENWNCCKCHGMGSSTLLSIVISYDPQAVIIFVDIVFSIQFTLYHIKQYDDF